MDIYILRHGETDYNKAGIVQGRGVDMPLNDTGRYQAQQFYNTYKDVKFDALYASALVRTHQTIELFKPHVPIYETDAALDEISWGVFEGKQTTPVFHKQYHDVITAWTEGNSHARMDGGESMLEVHERQRVFIDKLIKQPYNRVLIATHGRALRILLAWLLNNDLSSVEKFPHGNTCLYVVHYDDNIFTASRFNDLTHLDKATHAG